MIFICDTALDDIDSQILGEPPERGGALMGLAGRPLITHFIQDKNAKAGPARYKASDALRQAVERHERAGLEHKGIVHSHPRGMSQPSSQDLVAFKDSLDRNPHLAEYVVPIAVHDVLTGDGGNICTGNGTVSFWRATRTRANPLECIQVSTSIIPIGETMRQLAVALKVPRPEHVDVAVTDIEGHPTVSCDLALDASMVLTLIFHELFPLAAPIVLLCDQDVLGQISVDWLVGEELESNVDRLARAIGGDDRMRPASNVTPPDISAGLRARSGTLLGDLTEHCVLVTGLGSVGSFMAEGLTRAGVGRLVLIDDDHVDPANLSRTTYEAADLGRYKTDALRDLLLRINPDLDIEILTRRVGQVDAEQLQRLSGIADLVVAATDDPAAQRLLCAHAGQAGTPAVFPGLYRGAKGGEVVVSVPERTPCYQCATSIRHRVDARRGEARQNLDYGTGRLSGEIALAADIHHLSTAALKLALGALCLDAGGATSEFVQDIVDAGCTYLTLGMTPDYWFFPEIFESTPGQHAYQSVWLTPTADPDCPICGEQSLRTDVLTQPTTRPSATRIAETLGCTNKETPT